MKMRKILSLLVALGLAGLTCLPVSPCAAMHSRASECATPQTKTKCEHMAMVHAEQPPVAVSNAGKTCCVVSAAPSPEAQSWGGGFAFVPPPVLASGMIAAKTFPENAWSPDIA